MIVFRIRARPLAQGAKVDMSINKMPCLSRRVSFFCFEKDLGDARFSTSTLVSANVHAPLDSTNAQLAAWDEAAEIE